MRWLFVRLLGDSWGNGVDFALFCIVITLVPRGSLLFCLDLDGFNCREILLGWLQRIYRDPLTRVFLG